MRFALIFLAGLLHAFYTANITSVNNLKVTLDKEIKKGISGVVLCPYENEEIICARCVSFGKYAKLYPYSDLKNDAFALPIVYPKKGDKVIFGKDYERILIIAPNQTTYLKLKNRFKNYVIIPVDVFAAFLEDDMPKRKDFIDFAKTMDIGLFVFALDKLYFVDANSFYVISKEDFSSKKFKLPFYSSYNFDIKKVDAISYYKKILKGLND